MEEEEAASLAAAVSWQPRPFNDLKSIYNRTATEAPAELFRKDLISAMKLPDSEPLATDEYWVIVDQWKQEWERGVQVPVNPDSLPEPSVTVNQYALSKPLPDFKVPKTKYIRITKDEHFHLDQHVLSTAPTKSEAACSYDLDETDTAWLKLLNGERVACALLPVTEDKLERIIERLENNCWEKIQEVLRSEESEGLGIEYDENVICDVCRSPDSEEGNEMVFCDSCNICVHQACYGITRIPDGQWMCGTCTISERPKCVLCPNRGGAMKGTRSGRSWAHVSCALWIPEVSIGCVERMEPITKVSCIPHSRWALVCVLCRERVGACIQCSVKTCKTAYHVTCAFKHGLEMRAIIEDENADDGVKLRSYCEKHSKSSRRELSVCSDSEDDDTKRKKRKDMTSEEKNQARAARLHDIEAEFDKYVSIKDISSPLDVDNDAFQHIYNYWVLKRRAGYNKPLLPPKQDDIDTLSHKQEHADLEKMKMFVQLRQDLERVRNLCYMVSRREKLSRTFFRMREQTFHKQAAVLRSSHSLSVTVINAVIEANHGPSIYDRLYSHTESDDHNDFGIVLARIAGVKTKDDKPELNGLFKSVAKKENPYKRTYFNGSSKRRSASLYGSSSSDGVRGLSSDDERFKDFGLNMHHVIHARSNSSSADDEKPAPLKRKVRRPRLNKKRQKHLVSRVMKLESSSEEEIKVVRKSKLHLVRSDLGMSGTESDELPRSRSESQVSKAISSIYSESDSSNASNSQQSRVRTKAAVKEFLSKPSTSKNPSKTNPSTKKKSKPVYIPSDLIVPQREAAKKASEIMKSSTSNRVAKEIPEQASPLYEKPPSPPDTKSKTAKPKAKDVKVTPRKDSFDSDNEREDEVLLYVPQRQAAKKATENIKSGMGKPAPASVDNPGSDKDKHSEPTSKPVKIHEQKRKSSTNSNSSTTSHASSSSDSSGNSSTDTDVETNKPQSESLAAQTKRNTTTKDWPFLDKVANSEASSNELIRTKGCSSSTRMESLGSGNRRQSSRSSNGDSDVGARDITTSQSLEERSQNGKGKSNEVAESIKEEISESDYILASFGKEDERLSDAERTTDTLTNTDKHSDKPSDDLHESTETKDSEESPTEMSSRSSSTEITTTSDSDSDVFVEPFPCEPKSRPSNSQLSDKYSFEKVKRKHHDGYFRSPQVAFKSTGRTALFRRLGDVNSRPNFNNNAFPEQAKHVFTPNRHFFNNLHNQQLIEKEPDRAEKMIGETATIKYTHRELQVSLCKLDGQTESDGFRIDKYFGINKIVKHLPIKVVENNKNTRLVENANHQVKQSVRLNVTDGSRNALEKCNQLTATITCSNLPLDSPRLHNQDLPCVAAAATVAAAAASIAAAIFKPDESAAQNHSVPAAPDTNVHKPLHLELVAQHAQLVEEPITLHTSEVFSPVIEHRPTLTEQLSEMLLPHKTLELPETYVRLPEHTDHLSNIFDTQSQYSQSYSEVPPTPCIDLTDKESPLYDDHQKPDIVTFEIPDISPDPQPEIYEKQLLQLPEIYEKLPNLLEKHSKLPEIYDVQKFHEPQLQTEQVQVACQTFSNLPEKLHVHEKRLEILQPHELPSLFQKHVYDKQQSQLQPLPNVPELIEKQQEIYENLTSLSDKFERYDALEKTDEIYPEIVEKPTSIRPELNEVVESFVKHTRFSEYNSYTFNQQNLPFSENAVGFSEMPDFTKMSYATETFDKRDSTVMAIATTTATTAAVAAAAGFRELFQPIDDKVDNHLPKQVEVAKPAEPLSKAQADTIPKPLSPKDAELLDFDILEDGFGIAKTPLFPMGNVALFKEDSKEDSARETLNLVEKLRMELSKKSGNQDADETISIASSTFSNEIPKETEPVLIQNENVPKENVVNVLEGALDPSTTLQADERWVPPSTEYPFKQFPLSEAGETGLLSQPTPFLDHSSQSPYVDIHPQAKWADSQIMPTRRSSCSSAASTSSLCSRNEERPDVTVMNHQNLEMQLVQFHPQYTEPQFINPVSLFPTPAPNFNAQISFPSPGGAAFPPYQNSKPVESTICTAAFTSSEHNMALTAAMVNLPTPTPTPTQTPTPPTPIEPEVKSPKFGKKSPSKPTRSSARFQNKSPEKSPRTVEPKSGGGRGRADGKRGGRGVARRGRGRGRGGKTIVQPQHQEYDGNTINKLVGTVYDFDFDDDNDTMGDLKSMRERRKSSDVHISPKVSTSPKVQSPTKAASPLPPPPVVEPVLPGPVDMRTYNNFDESQSFSGNLISALETTEPVVQEDIDEATGGIKASLSDSRNQLKVKIKGPIANYTAAAPAPTIPNANVASVAVDVNSGTSNLRRMRKKELLRQYWTQENMDVSGSATVPAAATINRTIITIPKAVASLTSIPTKDDYRDYQTGTDDASDKVTVRKEPKARPGGLSRELKQLVPADALTERRRSIARAKANNIAPTLKIKLTGNHGIITDSMKDRIRPPKKRLSTIAQPSVEDLKRESMKFRKMMMANFADIRKKKKDKSSKHRKRKNQQVRIVTNDDANSTKLILRFSTRGDSEIENKNDEEVDRKVNNNVEVLKDSESNVRPIKLKLARCQAGSGYVMKSEESPRLPEPPLPLPLNKDCEVR